VCWFSCYCLPSPTLLHRHNHFWFCRFVTDLWTLRTLHKPHSALPQVAGSLWTSATPTCPATPRNHIPRRDHHIARGTTPPHTPPAPLPQPQFHNPHHMPLNAISVPHLQLPIRFFGSTAGFMFSLPTPCLGSLPTRFITHPYYPIAGLGLGLPDSAPLLRSTLQLMALHTFHWMGSCRLQNCAYLSRTSMPVAGGSLHMSCVCGERCACAFHLCSSHTARTTLPLRCTVAHTFCSRWLRTVRMPTHTPHCDTMGCHLHTNGFVHLNTATLPPWCTRFVCTVPVHTRTLVVWFTT